MSVRIQNHFDVKAKIEGWILPTNFEAELPLQQKPPLQKGVAEAKEHLAE